jgi:uncharacterized protein (DUF58 family)
MPNRRNGFYGIIIVCLLAGLITGRAFFFNIAYLFAGLLILSLVWSWTTVNWVQIRRQTFSRRAQVGRVLDEQFTVRNGGIVPKLWLEVRDQSDLPGHNASGVAPAMAPFGSYQWSARTICTVRGEFTLGPITLISGDPFGLYQATRHIPATSKLLVYPMTVPIQRFAEPTGLISGGDAQRQRAHFVTTNAAGVREYMPGDSFNRIHWKSSARKERMMVKEFELDPLADIWVLLDLSAAAHFQRPYTVDGTVGDFALPPSSAEYGIVIAASLTQHFLMKDRTFGFITYNPMRTMISPDRSNRQMTRILETLAVARIESDMTCEQFVALEGHHMGRGTTVIIITADPTDGWIREANLLVRRGIRTVAVLLDAASFGGAGVRPAEETRLVLENNGVLTYIVRLGDDITAALSTV